MSYPLNVSSYYVARRVFAVGDFMNYLLVYYTNGLEWVGDVGDLMTFMDLMEDEGLMDELDFREDFIISAVVCLWFDLVSATSWP